MKQPTHRFFGYTIDESVELVSNELEHDVVGLWQIIPKGREDFGLTGDALVDFARRHIIALIKKGAVPVRGLKEGGQRSGSNPQTEIYPIDTHAGNPNARSIGNLSS